MTPVTLASWPQHLTEWLEPDRAEGAPKRRPIEIAQSLEPEGNRFKVGTARDTFGTIILLKPSRPTEVKNKRKWRQAWAKVAVRAGYRSPGIDPRVYESLCLLTLETTRLEFIFDTTELISGGGHWLVRMFGSQADLIRTAISDKEVQGYRDVWGGRAATNETQILNRMNFLGACRFLEAPPHPHPVWRSLDVDDSALLLASGSKDGRKSPSADTLLLRAARRAIQDQVPRIRRFFVTGDTSLARSATHMLPHGSVISTWVNPIDPAGEYLSPLHWWPDKPSRDGKGHGRFSQLADFVWEALCLVAEIELTRPDGATLIVRAYKPHSNEFPSLWQSPVLWLEERNSIRNASASQAERTDRNPIDRDTASASGTQASAWPLTLAQSESDPKATGARLPVHLVLDAVTAVGKAAQAQRAKVPRPLDREEVQGREGQLRSFLVAVNLLTDEYRLGPAAAHLPQIFKSGDLDGLTSLLLGASPLADLVNELRKRRVVDWPCDEFAGMKGRKLSVYAALARCLGQAVHRTDSSRLCDGSAAPTEALLVEWLTAQVDRLAASDPLKEARIAELADSALKELRLSPTRFERALKALLRGPLQGVLEGVRGGTIEPLALNEEVAHLDHWGIRYRAVSADGLCGLRTLKRRRE